MENRGSKKSWSPYAVGAGIGLLSWFAFLTANHPLGITTPFEDAALILGKTLVSHFESLHPLYASRIASGQPPQISWEWTLVLGVFLGSSISAYTANDREHNTIPKTWQRRFGSTSIVRFIGSFIGGAIMMLGARLAQGCTTGHIISGNAQLAASSMVFTILFCAVSIITARVIYGTEESPYV